MRRMIIVLLPAALLCGCSASWWAGKDAPTTRLRLNPLTRTIDLENSKDVDSEITDLAITGASEQGPAELRLGKWKLVDNASAVREANAQQISAVAEAQKVQMQYMQAMGDSIVRPITGLLADTLPMSRGSSTASLTGAVTGSLALLVALGLVVSVWRKLR